MSLEKTNKATFDAFLAAYPNAVKESVTVFFIPVIMYIDTTLGYFPKSLIAKKKMFSGTVLKDFRNDQYYTLVP